MKARIKYQTPVCIQGADHTHTRVRVPTCLPRGKGISFVEGNVSSCPPPPPCHSSHHLRRLRKKRKGGHSQPTYGATKQSKQGVDGCQPCQQRELGDAIPRFPSEPPTDPPHHNTPRGLDADHRGTRVRVHPCRAQHKCQSARRRPCLHVLRDAGQATARRSGHQGRPVCGRRA